MKRLEFGFGSVPNPGSNCQLDFIEIMNYILMFSPGTYKDDPVLFLFLTTYLKKYN